MRNRLASSVLISTVAGVSFAVAMSMWAQAPPTPGQAAVAPVGGSQNPDTAKAVRGGRGRGGPPPGPTPHLADGHVDFSGVWSGGGPVGDIMQGMPNVPCDTPGAVPQAGRGGRGRGGQAAAPTCKEPIPYTAEGQKVKDSRLSKDDPEANCLPTGVPRQSPYPWRIVADPNHFYILFEGNIHSYRQVFMNAKHPADPDPTWYGHSTGTWDGDTLVVDTIGYNDKFWFDFAGNPHSEQLHTVERYTRTNSATLEIKTTIEDPVMYSKPFTLTFSARLQPNGELMEYICQENQQDAQHLQGKAGLN